MTEADTVYDEVDREARADWLDHRDAVTRDARPHPSEYRDLAR